MSEAKGSWVSEILALRDQRDNEIKEAIVEACAERINTGSFHVVSRDPGYLEFMFDTDRFIYGLAGITDAISQLGGVSLSASEKPQLLFGPLEYYIRVDMGSPVLRDSKMSEAMAALKSRVQAWAIASMKKMVKGAHPCVKETEDTIEFALTGLQLGMNNGVYTSAMVWLVNGLEGARVTAVDPPPEGNFVSSNLPVVSVTVDKARS